MKNRYRLRPDAHIYSAMFNVCASAKDLKRAKAIFKEMVSLGIRCDVITLVTMIDVYAECCNKHNARQYLKECRNLMEEMELKGVKANLQGFSTLLKLCSRGSLTTEALEILDDIRRNGIIPNVVCYSTVIDGISKDKKSSDKELLELSSQLVEEMKETEIKLDSLSYNSLIGIAFRNEDLERAIDLFSKMKKQGIKLTRATVGLMIKYHEKQGDPSTGDAYLKPCLDLLKESEHEGIKMNSHGYVSLLRACAKAANLETALEIWKKIEEQGVERTVPIYTAMINVYISGEDINGAVSLFSEMKREGQKPTLITYGTMLKCYAKLGDPSASYVYLQPCLDLLEECEQHGIKMNGPGYLSLLSACANVANLDVALQLWSKIDEEGLEKTVFLYNAMINVYISVKDMNGAVKLFTQMKSEGVRPNVVTYGTMIKCYKKLGDPSTGDAYLKPCLDLLRECEHHGIQIDESSFVSLSFLSACANVKNLDAALKVWKKAEEQGVAKDVFLYNSMINVYISVEDLAGAVNLFVEMKRKGLKPSEITYGTMIKCDEKLGDPCAGDAYLKPCLDLLAECEQSGIVMGLEGYTSVLSACANVTNLDAALEIWSKMTKAETKPDSLAFAAMIAVCLRAIDVDKAFAFLEEMEASGVKSNEVILRTFMTHFMKEKDRLGAQRFYNRMKGSAMKPDKDTLKMLKAVGVN